MPVSVKIFKVFKSVNGLSSTYRIITTIDNNGNTITYNIIFNTANGIFLGII
jgi:hypothetical protein